MNRDPFYDEIVRRLSGQLDSENFEHCAADILRIDFPGLVPVRGGGDMGMDGAVPDGLGEPFPLISTTSAKVLGNLTRNLDSYVSNGGARRKAILATSQQLTPKRRQNLHKRARDKGFTLVQIVDRSAMADRLYGNSAWCKDLLGLTGTPSALSAFPISHRPFFELPLIGRDSDVAWLNAQTGDCLISGQPGSGKTFLLQRLVSEGKALFLVSENETDIANALREQRPPIVIVDDAHVYTKGFDVLRHLRQELGLEFAMFASCWPGATTELAEKMTLVPTSVRGLELLPRDDMVRVVRAGGLVGPDELIRAIVSQAEGRPGLGITLTRLCLQGETKAVVLGDALARSVRGTLEPLVGEEALQLLAAFALGGDYGMRMGDVASVFGLSLLNIQRAIAKLSAGGVIIQAGRDYLSVRPPELRYSLIRDVFFCGAAALMPVELLKLVPDPEEAAITLSGCKSRGSNIPSGTIRRLLEALPPPYILRELSGADSDSAAQSDTVRALLIGSRTTGWVNYASLGRRETEDALEQRPNLLEDLAPVALAHWPDRVIELLLEHAIGDTRNISGHPRQPLRQLRDWVQKVPPGAEAMRRRRCLRDTAIKWIRGGRDERVGMQALAFAMLPLFELLSTDPGSGMTLKIRAGHLPSEQQQQIEDMWHSTVSELASLQVQAWASMLDALYDWAHPGHSFPSAIPQSLWHEMRQAAGRMVASLAKVTQGRPGVQHRLSQFARMLKTRPRLNLSDPFELLFPDPDPRDWKADIARDAKAAHRLADQWSADEPTRVAEQLVYLESEALSAGRQGYSLAAQTARRLASIVTDRLRWATAFSDAGVSADVIAPFVLSAATDTDAGLEDFLCMCMDKPNYVKLGTYCCLTQANVSRKLMGQAIANATLYSADLDTMVMQGHVPDDVVTRLLSHEEAGVRAATAVGIWHAEPKGVIPPEIAEQWGQAILDCPPDDYRLVAVLRSDIALAREWLLRHLEEGTCSVYMLSEAERAAIEVLDTAARAKLLADMSASRVPESVLKALIGKDVGLYRTLLSLPDLRSGHFVPLELSDQPADVAMLAAAIAAGYSPEEVFRGVWNGPFTWEGEESSMWLRWMERFRALRENPDPAIRKIGEDGERSVERLYQNAVRRERQEAVFGLD
jgi:hypothetical protein